MLQKAIACLLILSLCFSPIFSVGAQASVPGPSAPRHVPTTTKATSGGPCIANGILRPQYVDEGTASLYRERLLASDHFGRFVAGLSSTEFVLQLSAIQVVELEALHAIGVYVPIVSSVGAYSFYAEWYDAASDELLAAVSALFSFDQAGNIVAKIDQDEQPKARASMSTSGDLLGGFVKVDGVDVPLEASSYSPSGVIDFLGCIIDCMIKNGVPDFIVVLITKLCEQACKAFWSVPCWACIALYIGIWLPVLIYCWGVCGPQEFVFLPLVASTGRTR